MQPVHDPDSHPTSRPPTLRATEGGITLDPNGFPTTLRGVYTPTSATIRGEPMTPYHDRLDAGEYTNTQTNDQPKPGRKPKTQTAEPEPPPTDTQTDTT